MKAIGCGLEISPEMLQCYPPSPTADISAPYGEPFEGWRITWEGALMRDFRFRFLGLLAAPAAAGAPPPFLACLCVGPSSRADARHMRWMPRTAAEDARPPPRWLLRRLEVETFDLQPELDSFCEGGRTP